MHWALEGFQRLRSLAAASGSVTLPLPVAEKGRVEEAGEKKQCKR